MVRNRLFTSINILGLSVSIACCLLIFLYVSDQLNYDTHHGEDIYRINSLITQKGGSEVSIPSTSVPIAPAVQAQIPEIETAARMIDSEKFGKDVIFFGDESFYIKNGAVADSSIFQIFTFDIIAGSPEMPLPNGNSVVLERTWAKKLFGEETAIGKVVRISTRMGESEFMVSAVYNKNTYNTHVTPSFIISTSSTHWNAYLSTLSAQWVTNNFAAAYIKCYANASTKVLEEKIDQLFRKNGAEGMKAYGMDKKMSLQPIHDIHTNINFSSNIDGTVSKTFINVLIGIGVLILALACVNYINLSTAQASNRALEVGVRKVMGITSKGLITQFLGESFIIIFVSLGFSILLVEFTLPIFNQFIGKPITLNSANIGVLSAYLVGFLFVTTLLAGLYPAMYLSSFKPTSVLKGKNKDKGGTAILRKVLVTVQFVISIVLISAILVISRQVEFIKNKDLGFAASQRIVVPLANDLDERAPQLKEQFKSLAQVERVGGSGYIPGMFIFSDLFVYKHGETMDEAIHIYQNEVDTDFTRALDMTLVSGNHFREDAVDDSLTSRVILNTEAVRQFGFSPEEIIGEQLHIDWEGITYNYDVVGVTKDVNQFSLHQAIEPIMLVLDDGIIPNLVVHTNADNYPEMKADLEDIWDQLIPDAPFEAFPLEDHLIAQYESDFKTFDLIKYFAIISVFISCMGLYALSMYVAERRFKEIGVRKALGAEVKDILILVSKDLSALVIIAFIISIPISVYAMNQWLDGFAYKISQDVWTYVIAGCITILVAWLTISYQSIRAALTNPVNVLRDD